MEPKNPILNFDLVHDYALAVERLRVLATPTAIDAMKRILILTQDGDEPMSRSEIVLAQMFADRSMRRTIRTMARLGLIRWEPWTWSGPMILTGTTKKILRAAGCPT